VDAEASPMFDLTGGTDGLGGLQPGTVEGGASAAYFNPALLTDLPFGLSLGFMVVSTQIGVTLAARPGTQFDVPAGIANATYPNGSSIGNTPIPTSQLQNGIAPTALNPVGLPARPRQGAGTGHQTVGYETVGFVAKLLDNRLGLGFYGIIPDGDFTNLDAFYPDEREQFFSNSLHPELYGDRLTALSLGFGAGYRISDQLAVGLGASLSLAAGVAAPTYVANVGALNHLLIDTNASVNVSLSPNVGLSYQPTSRWHFTGTVHAPEKVDLSIGFTFLLPSGTQQGSSLPLVYDYMPWQIGAGAAYDIVQHKDETLTVAGTAMYQKWSDYVDRHGEAPIAAYGWYDTLTPTVGARYRYGATGTFVDLQYKPSPVPLQTGRSDYVDNDRVGADVGVDYAFTFMHTSMRVGAQALFYWLVPRYQTKLPTPNEPDGLNHYPALVADELPDNAVNNGLPVPGSQGLQTNNPGWPGFGSEGVVLGGGIYLTVTP
jgi:long-chain fatty acid transport protein